MEISLSQSSEGCEFSVSGEFTIFEIEKIQKAVSKQDNIFEQDIIFDIRKITEFDGAGLQFLQYLKKCLGKNGILLLKGDNEIIENIFKTLCLETEFTRWEDK